MIFKVDYKLINPKLEYSKPVKMIIFRYSREIKRHYLITRNPLKEKYKAVSYFYIEKGKCKERRNSNIFRNYKKPELYLNYNKPVLYLICKIQRNLKIFNFDLFGTDLLDKFTIVDYFFIRNIPYDSLCLNIKSLRPQSLTTNNVKEVNNRFVTNKKYHLISLKDNNTTDVKYITIKKCFFNLQRMAGNEELYLYIKENHELIEIEEDSDLICIIDNNEYFTGDIINIF